MKDMKAIMVMRMTTILVVLMIKIHTLLILIHVLLIQLVLTTLIMLMEGMKDIVVFFRVSCYKEVVISMFQGALRSV